MNASCIPELRKECIEHTERKGNARRKCDKRIHVGFAVTCLFKCMDEKVSSKIKDHRSSKDHRDDIAIRHTCLSGRQVHKKHSDNHHRHSQYSRPNRALFYFFITFLLRLLLDCLRIFSIND